MIRNRRRALAGGLIVISLLVFATAAFAATVRKFAGNTSQQQTITFRTAHGFLTHLQFQINDTCPSGHIWRVHDSHFPKIQITNSKFDGKFKSRDGTATAVVKGTVGATKASGTVTERRFIRAEHQHCSGSMKFTATHHK
jgi:hypothetical protein